jgi:Patatin-like phospholipase
MKLCFNLPKHENNRRLSAEDVHQEERLEIENERVQRLTQGECPRIWLAEHEAKDSEEKRAGQAYERHIGLSFSGGGIRSATFNLGVLQALREQRLLPFVDYLSTVSGGGYVGSWFTATNYRLAQTMQQDPAAPAAQEAQRLYRDWNFLSEGDPPVNAEALAQAPMQPAAAFKHVPMRQNAQDPAGGRHQGSALIHHLRCFSRYLAPKSGITSADVWTMTSIWLRNTVLMQVTICAGLALLIGLVAMLPFLFRSLTALAVMPKGGVSLSWITQAPVWTVAVLLQMICILVICRVCVKGVRRVQLPQKERVGLGSSAVGSALILVPCLLIGSFLAGVQLWRMGLDEIPVFGWLKGSAATEHPVRALFPLDPSVALMVLVVSWLSVWVSYRSLLKTQRRKKSWGFWLVSSGLQWAAGMGLIHAVSQVISWLNQGATAHDSAQAYAWGCLLLPVMIMLGYCCFQVISIGLLGGEMSESVREWWGRAGAWVLMGTTLFIISGLTAVMGPVLLDWVELQSVFGSSLVMGWVLTLMLGLLAGKSPHTGRPGKVGPLEVITSHLPLLFLIGLLLAVSWCVRVWMWPEGHQPQQSFLLEAYPPHEVLAAVKRWGVLMLICTVIVVLMLQYLDLNTVSMNPFYRNRLTRCYLGGSRLPGQRRVQPVTGFDRKDDLFMSLLSHGKSQSKSAEAEGAPGFRGPFHIINTAVNAGASAGLDVQDRSAESFIFTPLHVGYSTWRMALGDEATAPEAEREKRICYRPARGFDGKKGWTLGTAMSVSGAAASPNSGYHTSPLVAFMLTMFNARLGWWVLNPQKKTSTSADSSPITAGLSCLLAELTGSASLNSDFIYLSDGGHFENLGLYELVRRRCRIIIVGDAECDPQHQFHGLGMAIRRCRIDFGAEIVIDTTPLLPDPTTGLCRNHGVAGRVIYADGQEALLFYLKSSLTGDEPLDVKQYRSEHATFPHETTGDQFYTEAQFESYRQLGRHAANQFLCPNALFDRAEQLRHAVPLPNAGQIQSAYRQVEAHFSKLHSFWTEQPAVRVSSFVQHSDALMRLWQQAAKRSELSPLDESLLFGLKVLGKVPTVQPRQLDPAEAGLSRELGYTCQQIIQLMENVFLDLDLAHHFDHPDHRGWMTIFLQWVQDPILQQVWPQTRQAYGHRFQHFWDEVLCHPEVQKKFIQAVE